MQAMLGIRVKICCMKSIDEARLAIAAQHRRCGTRTIQLVDAIEPEATCDCARCYPR